MTGQAEECLSIVRIAKGTKVLQPNTSLDSACIFLQCRMAVKPDLAQVRVRVGILDAPEWRPNGPLPTSRLGHTSTCRRVTVSNLLPRLALSFGSIP